MVQDKKGRAMNCPKCKKDITAQCEAYHAEKIRERASKAGSTMTDKRRAALARARASKKPKGER